MPSSENVLDTLIFGGMERKANLAEGNSCEVFLFSIFFFKLVVNSVCVFAFLF